MTKNFKTYRTLIASVKNSANTQMCCVFLVPVFVFDLLTLGNNHSHSNNPPMVSRFETGAAGVQLEQEKSGIKVQEWAHGNVNAYWLPSN